MFRIVISSSLVMIVSSLLGIGAAVADDAYIDELVARADSLALADTRAWHALLHYKPGGLFHDWMSQADDDAFFLSAGGKYLPAEELVATIRSLDDEVEDTDRHPQCRFPARFHWLHQQLEIDPGRLKPVECKELAEWFDTLSPGSLTLVFPAAYINSPSSMFGHTLLRVNPDDYRKDSPLVAYALNYAANADATDSALVFTIKGLVGGYPGIFSIVPYFEKIREYSDLENRDIWEYDLDFSRDEVLQLMRHAWEVRHIQFDYYFLSENCSYHMLSLMEAARPGLQLTSRFESTVIPVDTVRAVFANEVVENIRYRPSSTMILKQHAARLGEEGNARVHAIIDGDSSVAGAVDGLDSITRARIFEQAYDYARFLSTADPSVRDARANLNWQLLAARSELAESEVWEPVPTPSVRAEQGHDTARLALGAGAVDSTGFLSIQLRPSYHDVLDPPAGYSRGAQINFGDVSARYYYDERELRLEKFTVINVLSLTPRDDYFDPISWGADIGVERQPGRNGMLNAAQVVVNGGFSAEPLPAVVVSLLGEVNARAAGRYDKGYSAGVGIKLNLLTQRDAWSLQTSIKAVSFDAGEANLHQQFDLGFGYHLGMNDALRLTLKRARDYDSYRSDVRLAWHSYF